jgi:rRNA maturation endonuclease Nob1
LNAETETREAEAAPDPWWTSAVPGLVVIVGIAAGLTLGAALGAAPGAIFLGGSVLIGAILLFWSSVRLLLGEKLPGVDLSDEIAGRTLEDPLLERKRAALAALQDMDRERDLGKISPADYDEVVLPLREQAKAIMKELDARVAPYRSEAERLATEHLASAGVAKSKAVAEMPVAETANPAREAVAEKADARVTCPACDAANEPDARFCKSCGKPLEVADAS